MRERRTIEGKWWIHGDDKAAHFGTLVFDPETGLELTVKIPQSRSDAERFRTMHDPASVPTAIHGKDQHGHDVTAFEPFHFMHDVGSGLETYQIGGISAAIQNMRGESLDEPRFAVASVGFTLLAEWMNRKSVLSKTVEDGVACLKLQCHDRLEFQLETGVTLRIERAWLPQFGARELNVQFEYRIWLVFCDPRSAMAIYKGYACVLLRLLSLLTGERVFIEELSFYDCDPFVPGQGRPPKQSEFLTTNRGVAEAKRSVPAALMITRFEEVEGAFLNVLRRWFECHARLEPVLDLYFAILANRASSMESRFLFLAQALEVYHARSAQFTATEILAEDHQKRITAVLNTVPPDYLRWVREKLAYSNQKTLARRLDDILKLHPAEAAKLAAGVHEFAAKVRHTRNYYTHYDEELRRKGKIAEGAELRRVVFALEDLLQICLLKELGIQGPPIERILQRSASSE